MTDFAENSFGIYTTLADLVKIRARLLGLSRTSPLRRASTRVGAVDVRMRGRGMEYEETRTYMVGDDVRAMDWRVMARTGEAHTKIFAEEKERSRLLAIDLSASMYFGTRYAFKSWAAVQAAAHVGWFASLGGDRLGGLIVTPTEYHEVRPDKARSSLMTLFRHLAVASRTERPNDNGNRFERLLRETLRVAKSGSIITVITDFINLDPGSSQLLTALTRQYDVSAIWVYDETEIQSWPRGCYPVLIDNDGIELDLTRHETATWLSQRIQEHREQIESVAGQLQLALFPISSNRDVSQQITPHLRQI